jgi:bile acid:Na+ symporter, BASS family
MQSGLALSLGLPVVLCIIMLGLGLSLRLEDFLRVLAKPKPVIVALFCQAVILPAFCLAMLSLSDLPPAIAVGFMLLAASPSGTSGALYTHLARGDVALSITIAALSSVLALISLPIIANLSMVLFNGEGAAVYLRFGQVLQIFAIAIVPAMIGAFIQGRFPETALRLERPVKTLATVFLVAVVLFALVSQRGVVVAWGPSVGTLALAFNLVSLAIGYYVPRLLGVDRSKTIAITMTIGIHNAALVITLALSEQMLGNAEMAIAPAIYGLLAYLTAGILVWVLNRRRQT